MTQTHLEIVQSAYYSTVTAHGTWAEAAETVMRQLADTHKPFTADDFRDLMGDHEPPTPNAIGAIFSAWAGAHIITHIGWAKSRFKRNSRRDIKVWISTRTTPQEAAA